MGSKCFDQGEEKDPYYNFLKLHLTKEHGKAGKQRWDARRIHLANRF
jgi:hypothetical protein